VAKAEPPISAANPGRGALAQFQQQRLGRADIAVGQPAQHGRGSGEQLRVDTTCVVPGMTNGSAYSDMIPISAPRRQHRTVSVGPSGALAWTRTSPVTTS
jgi:hypothetical protein